MKMKAIITLIIASLVHCWGLADSVKELFLVDIKLKALVENTTREDTAFSTLASQPQFSADLAKLCGTFFNGFPDLAIGYSIAHANVHNISRYLFII